MAGSSGIEDSAHVQLQFLHLLQREGDLQGLLPFAWRRDHERLVWTITRALRDLVPERTQGLVKENPILW